MISILTREDSLVAIQASSPPILCARRSLNNLYAITCFKRQVSIRLTLGLILQHKRDKNLNRRETDLSRKIIQCHDKLWLWGKLRLWLERRWWRRRSLGSGSSCACNGTTHKGARFRRSRGVRWRRCLSSGTRGRWWCLLKRACRGTAGEGWYARVNTQGT